MIDATFYRNEQEEIAHPFAEDFTLKYEEHKINSYRNSGESRGVKDFEYQSSGSETNEFADDIDLHTELHFVKQQLDQKEQEAALAAKLGAMLLEANKQLTNENKELWEKLELQMNDNKECKGKILQTGKELKETTSTIEHLETQLKNSDTSNNRLTNQIASLEEQLIKYKSNLKDYDYLSKRNKDLSDQLARLEEDFKTSEEQNSDLKKKIKQLESEKAVLKHTVASLQESITLLQEDLIRFENQRERDSVILVSVKELNSQIAMLYQQNIELKRQLEEKESLIEERNNLKMENKRLQSEWQQDQHLLLCSREEIDHLKNKEIVPAEFVSQGIVKGSFLYELEEQVAKRVEEELRKSEKSKHAVLEPFTEQDLEKPHNKQLSSWENFLSYLPLLRTAKSTRELITNMSTQELQQFNTTLAKVVNAYSGRLVEVLEEREEIRSEREFRVVLIKQLLERQNKNDAKKRAKKKLFSSPFK